MLETKTFRIGRFEAALLHLDTFALDGGAMFGIVPKTLWNRVYECDDENRITLFGSSLFVQANGLNILVETGMGVKLSEKERRHCKVSNEQSFHQALEPFSLAPADIDIVILTHLHFDHAGGATTINEGRVSPTFPNARYLVQRTEYESACHANERTRGSYHEGDYLPLKESGNIDLLDGDYDLAPGVRMVKTGGHTPGHQIVFLESDDDRVAHTGDLVPTSSHLPLPYIMGYDTHPLITLEKRKKLYCEIIEKDMRAVFPHDIHHTVAEAAAFTV